jgi:hypothetical protein
MGSNPERDWGLPSWPTGGGGKPPKGPKITYHGGARGPNDSGCRKQAAVIALVLLGLPAGLVAAVAHGMGWL